VRANTVMARFQHVLHQKALSNFIETDMLLESKGALHQDVTLAKRCAYP